MTSVEQALQEASRLLLEKGETVLTWVVQARGSVPRGSGSCMVTRTDGTFYGTIGGGRVEFVAQQLSLKAMEEKRSFTHEFILAPNDREDLGMICGGGITTLFLYLNSKMEGLASVFAKVEQSVGQRESVWLAMALPEGERQVSLALWNGDGENLASMGAAACWPEKGKKRGPVFIQERGTLFYIQPLHPGETVYIFGGGHVSQQLVPVLSTIFFQCVVVENRPEYADPALFPLAKQCVLCEFPDALSHIQVEVEDYIAIMTRGHKNDAEALREALKTKASYIGLIGSRNKIGITFTNLIQSGEFSYRDVERVHAPIGLPTGGDTPEEIAVSIAAEMLLHRTKRFQLK